MEQTLETAQLEQKEVIIMGDVNIDWLDEQAKEEEWQRVVKAFQMTRVTGEPTRVTASTETLIDHIIDIYVISPYIYITLQSRCMQYL